MGKPTGFLEHGRELPQKIDPAERIKEQQRVRSERGVW